MGSGPLPAAGQAEPFPVAFLGRTSTLHLQDPVASLNRQYRIVQEKLLPGWFIAACYWDIESGGIDLDQRGRSDSWTKVDTGIPRDGGMADLLAEAASPAPRFAAVMCENIERSARDTLSALRLERDLSDQGIMLCAADEPISITGMNPTALLIRRVKQGVAEWYRFQVKNASWDGLIQHSLAGWNIGRVPYGYTGIKEPHPVPDKAAMGLTKTRLAPDPGRAPVVAQIFQWRTEGNLGRIAIAGKLNADPAAYPPPDAGHGQGWTQGGVLAILRNPKYTGHMVFGRRTEKGGKQRKVPRADWLWTPEPTHAPIISRDMWEAAQVAGALHSTSRDDPGLSSHPAARRTYVLRSHVRCNLCQHRMCGTERANGPGRAISVYYRCPHSVSNPRHVAAHPDHPASINLREAPLLAAIRQFFDERITGPDRAKLLAADAPADAETRAAQTAKKRAALDKRLRKIDSAETAHAREIEALAEATTPDTAAAITALRTRLIGRFTELEAERADINGQLAALDAAPDTRPGDPALLDALPDLAGILHDAPMRLQQQLYDAFDLQVLYRHDDKQATIRATITTSTPATVAAIIHDHHQLHDTGHLRTLPHGRTYTTEPDTYPT